jgi:NAD(P)-dependent dehydrogenase (short-subunit alcohol dehydrogenase family)
MNELEGRVAIVTGSSRGIGEGIARRLGLAGAKVVVTARTVEVRDERLPGTVHSVAQAINDAGGEAIAVAANLQKKPDREQLAGAALDAYGRVDILVNNAAILVPGATVDFPERYFDRMFEILVKAPHHLCQLVLPGMIERGSGSVLNISSKAAIHPKPGQRSYDGAVYGMAKAAIERFTTGLAAEMFENGISVNALSPDRVVATPGQMFGRRYSQEMLDASEPVEAIAEAAFALVSGDPRTATGGIRYTDEVLEAFAVKATDIGMAAPAPN